MNKDECLSHLEIDSSIPVLLALSHFSEQLSTDNIMELVNNDGLFREVFERFPFAVIFSKTAPSGDTPINYDTDFCYFYFSPGLNSRSSLLRSDLCNGATNSKSHFPDFQSYFEDDRLVMKSFADGKVFAFSEPWNPPGAQTFTYTLKTAMCSEDKDYMLGCFEIVDDVTLGITKFKRIAYNASSVLPSFGTVPSYAWFKDAFKTLPLGVAILSAFCDVLFSNAHWPDAEESLIDYVCNVFSEVGVSLSSDDFQSEAFFLVNRILSRQKRRPRHWDIWHHIQ